MKTQHTVGCHPNSNHNPTHNPQHILQDLIDSLGLPICLRMERCTELQPSAQDLMQLTPKPRSKLYLCQTQPCLELHANTQSCTYKSWLSWHCHKFSSPG